jgi:electron transfer flavoprotein alpha subunit
MTNNILTFCAASAENLPSASLEVLAAARKLGDELGNANVQSLLLGSGVEAHGETLVQHGADEVFFLSHPNLEHHEAEVMLGVLEAAVRQISPGVILFPHDDLSGGHLAPRLAHRLGAGIVTDCTDFSMQDGTIRWLRPVYGGKAMAYMIASGPVQLATMRALAFEPLPANSARQGQVQAMEIDVTSISPQVPIVDQIVAEEEFEGLSLDQANIIVSGGRGMEAKDNFAVLRELANVLGAAVGGSRPAADLGWVPHSHLVGQTGKIVAPNLYIAVAISGAPQHMAGAGSARTIVAINKDEDAPIFKVANIGVVDEWQNVLPTMIEECKKITRK